MKDTYKVETLEHTGELISEDGQVCLCTAGLKRWLLNSDIRTTMYFVVTDEKPMDMSNVFVWQEEHIREGIIGIRLRNGRMKYEYPSLPMYLNPKGDLYVWFEYDPEAPVLPRS